MAEPPIINAEKPHEKDPLPPHTYPMGLKIMGAIVALLFLYSLWLLPRYFSSAKLYERGQMHMSPGEYSQAIEAFTMVLESFPSSKKTKLALAKAYFSNEDTEDDVNGIIQLAHVEISESEWSDLTKVMPEAYQVLFTDVEK